jgi:hypothetical protein
VWARTDHPIQKVFSSGNCHHNYELDLITPMLFSLLFPLFVAGQIGDGGTLSYLTNLKGFQFSSIDIGNSLNPSIWRGVAGIDFDQDSESVFVLDQDNKILIYNR